MPEDSKLSNIISVNLGKTENLIKILPKAEYEDIIIELKKRLPKLKNFYKDEKVPLYVMGKELTNKEMDEIKKLIQDEIDVDVNFETPTDMGIHVIKKTFEEDLTISETKLVKGAIRSGIKIEFEKSIVVIGDVNAGAEIIAGGNIIITGALRGLAHAGAKGNKKAIIMTNKLEAPQIRIANVLREMEKEEEIQNKPVYAFLDNDKIKIEEI